MAIPYRSRTSQSTYFVTGNCYEKKSLFQTEMSAELFIDVLFGYRDQGKYLVQEFVLMPDHFHALLTPTGPTLERALGLIKGGFSFRAGKELKWWFEIWQPSFADRRVRDSAEYFRFKNYIYQNPVKRFLTKTPEEYRYSSASGRFRLDPVPQWLKPQIF